MYLLDTNTVSNYLDKRRSFPQLKHKILSTPPELIFISIITVEEIIRGSLAIIQKQKQKSSIADAYKYFEELFEALHYFQILPYTNEAEQIYQSLSAKVKRIGTQDCRISALANSKEYIVVTANLADFEKIGIAQVEDWTI
ncbi:MAG: type II toxin-antitoxin system VapC family toxin [Mastigocoleus sp.]